MDVTPMEHLAQMYGGFTSPWQSTVEGWSGEDAYTALVAAHLSGTVTLLEAGCGHGAEALDLAGKVDRVIAFDAAQAFIEIAKREAADRHVRNVEFIATDCSPKRNDGRAVLPVPDGSVDLIASRRGPTSWIPAAPRALRPRGVMIHLAFMQPPEPAWNRLLPKSLRLITATETMPSVVLERLAGAGVDLHSSWVFDVPERFLVPVELYNRLAWERKAPVPPYDEVSADFDAVFERHGDVGVTIRQRRYLWKAVV